MKPAFEEVNDVIDESAPFGFSLTKNGLKEFIAYTQSRIDSIEGEYRYLKGIYNPNTCLLYTSDAADE